MTFSLLYKTLSLLDTITKNTWYEKLSILFNFPILVKVYFITNAQFCLIGWIGYEVIDSISGHLDSSIILGGGALHCMFHGPFLGVIIS